MVPKFLIGLLIVGIVLVSGCTFKVTTFTITDAKMATGMDEDGYPIGVATTFSVTEPEIHIWFSWAHAPSDTKVRAIFNYVPGNAKVEIPEITLPTIDGTGSFHLKKPVGDRPAGEYRVDIYSDDKVVKSLSFSVE